MDRTSVAALVGTLLLSLVCGAAIGGTRTQLASNEMAIEVYGGYLVVARGSVNNADNLRFLLDTGASNTAIDRRVADRLGLHGQPAKVINFDKTVALEWTEVEEMTFGPERIRNVRVMIEDLGYLRSTGTHVDGVIGLDYLRRQSFLVDYARERVVFGPTATGGMHSVPMRVDAKSIRVEVDLDGRPVWMVADIGTRGIILYEDTLKDLLANWRGESGWTSRKPHSHRAAPSSGRPGSRQGSCSNQRAGSEGTQRRFGIPGTDIARCDTGCF